MRGKLGPRPPYSGRSGAHHFIPPSDREAEPGGEGRIEHAERVREADLALQGDVGALCPAATAPGGERRPFADAICGEEGGGPGRRGQESGGGVRLVMFGEQDLLARHAEPRSDDAAHPQLLAQRILHRMGEGAARAREGAQHRGQDAVELQHRPLVEDDGVEFLGLEPGAVEAIFDRAEREGRIVLAPREALLLHRRHRQAVDRRPPRVVIRRETEDLHQIG